MLILNCLPSTVPRPCGASRQGIFPPTEILSLSGTEHRGQMKAAMRKGDAFWLFFFFFGVGGGRFLICA